MKEQIFTKFKDGMEKTISSLEKSFSRVRTGRASVSLLDGIKVDYYGTPTPIAQVASLSVPESRLIVITPWDATAIGAIEKAIQKSDLGLMPSTDGKVIRLSIPQLTEERRKELVKVTKKKAEETKVAIRNIRREALDKYRTHLKKKEITEDSLSEFEIELQKLTDRYIADLDKIANDKEKDLMEL